MSDKNQKSGFTSLTDKLLRVTLAGGVSTLAMAATAAHAQDAATAAAPEEEVIVVVGLRGSLERSMEMKRNATGVVDSISAEDIGKFPDTNLAESLQRITGVSINRVNGEGSEVTVRGFGPGYNLVTFNGRTMPTASVATIGGDEGSNFATGSSRSFDFSNFAADSISGLDVYKTGRASVASGGIGATLNVRTAKPLDRPGFRGSVSAKGIYDQSAENDPVTPEITGVFSWTDPSDSFGIALSGSYQKTDRSYAASTVNGWNISTYDQFISAGRMRVSPPGVVTNAPAGTKLIGMPDDARWYFAEANAERVNVSGVVQFRPVESLTFTLDGLFTDTKSEEQRWGQTNWFNRPFDQAKFEANAPVATTLFLQENLDGNKDMGFEQQYRGVEDKLTSIGFNAEWLATDRLTFEIDAHSSKSESLPNNPMGVTATTVAIAAPVLSSQGTDYSGDIPLVRYTINDAGKGNNNGVLDVGDLGSQVGRTVRSSQIHEVQEIAFNGSYDFDGVSKFDFGVSYRDGKMTQANNGTYRALGDWGVTQPRDVNTIAPGVVTAFCMACKFDKFNPGDTKIAFRSDATELYRKLQPVYGTPGVDGDNFNVVEEEVFALFGQLSSDFEFIGKPANIVAGLRYESTEVTSSSLQLFPTSIDWVADNDFQRNFGTTKTSVKGVGSYTSVLPSLDFSMDLTDEVKGRVSFSKTLARPSFGSLFAATSLNAPPRPIFSGGIPSGTSGNPDLLPLISDNVDFSLEWYYGKSSYISAGFYNKNVSNFEGTGQASVTYPGLYDPSSGKAGTLSATAITAVTGAGQVADDVNVSLWLNLYGVNGNNVAATTAAFNAQVYPGGIFNQANADAIWAATNVSGTSADPLYVFQITRPINNREARLYGWELAGQHFFGDTGFAIAGSYTTVSGDVSIDVAADPSVDQFALLGLSDTYNVTFIYDKNGLSGRLSYNWRDEYLAQTNRGGGNRNPVFAAPFGQWDFAVSYELTDNVSVTLDGINLNKESLRTYGRDDNQLWYAQELDTRYQLGVRYKF